MSSSLSNLVNNLSEGLHNDKCTDCKSCLDYMIFKDDQLIFRCFKCKKVYKNDFNKELIKRFANIHEFYYKDIKKSILLLRKGVYPYEYMDSWERFDQTSLPDKEAFYSNLNIEDITDVDVQSDTLLLADVFEDFRNKCIEIYELHRAHFLSATGSKLLKLELLTKNDMLLMVEKELEVGYVMQYIDMQKQIIST